jgi:hypothetical protein
MNYQSTKEAILFLMGMRRKKEWHVAYNYMVTTLTHAAMTLDNGNCNEHVVTMYQDNCSKVILDWYGIATR